VAAYSVRTAEGKLCCTLCQHITHKTYNMRSHLEGKHKLTSGYRCEGCCEVVATTKQALYKHKLACHQPATFCQ